MRPDGGDLRYRLGDLPFDLARGSMRVLEGQVCRELQVQRDLGAVLGSQHRKIVDLAHLRHVLRRGQGPLAQRGLVFLRLDVDDDVALRQRLVDRRLDRVRRGVALADCGSRRDADDDVRELPAPGLPHPQTPQLHKRLEPPDRSRSDGVSLGRNAVHQNVDVPAHQPRGSGQDEQRNEERGGGVSLLPPGADAEQAAEHCNRAGKVAREVNGIRL